MEAVAEQPKAEQPKVKVTQVTAPEHWAPATDVKEERSISTVRGQMKFMLRALSYAEENLTFVHSPDPEPPEVKRGMIMVKNPDDPDYKDRLAAAKFRRYVETIDKCWSSLPGATLEEKVEWAQEHLWRGGDMLNLYYEILSVSGYGRAQKPEDESEIAISTPQQWMESSKVPTLYSFERAGERLVFSVKGISSAKMKQIELSTDPGQPPVELTKSPAGDRRGIPVPNYDNPRYKRKVEECHEARNVMMLENALGFSVPGTTVQEKIAWVGQRPSGEVSELIRFLKQDVMSYRSNTDFM